MGYNMFAYCNNNSVNSADPAGYAAWGTNLVSICDGSGTRAMISTTDGKKGSQDLLDDIKQNNGVPISNGTVRVHVEYAGIYSKTTDESFANAVTGIGIASEVFSKTAGVGKVIGAICGGVGKVLLAYEAAVILYKFIVKPEKQLEDGDYYQYKVTMTWTDATPYYYGNQNSGYYTITDYVSTSYYVWNDARFGEEHWHQVGYSCEFVSTTAWIP